MLEVLELPFLQRVLLAGLLASIASGIIGSYVVSKRITAISGGLSHAAFGGVGLGYLMGFDPLLGAMGFGVVAGALIALGYRRMRSALDTLVSMVWSVGMALGILFVSMAPGYAPDLTSYLFGSLLFVPWDYVVLVGLVDAAILLAVALFFREFQAVCFDEEFAEVSGVPVDAFFVLLLALTALGIVALIRVVGVILAIALVSIPAAVARHWTSTLSKMMLLAVLLCAACTLAGLFASYGLSETLDLSAPPGPLIVLSAASLYGASSLAAGARGRRSGG